MSFHSKTVISWQDWFRYIHRFTMVYTMIWRKTIQTLSEAWNKHSSALKPHTHTDISTYTLSVWHFKIIEADSSHLIFFSALTPLGFVAFICEIVAGKETINLIKMGEKNNDQSIMDKSMRSVFGEYDVSYCLVFFVVGAAVSI